MLFLAVSDAIRSLIVEKNSYFASHFMSYFARFSKLSFSKLSFSLLACLRLGAVLAFALLLGAYILQYFFGYQPCELCLQQRVIWWLLLVVFLLAQLPLARKSRACGYRGIYLRLWSMVALLLLLASFGLSLYHAGGERGLWALSLFCDGAGFSSALTQDLTVAALRELLLTREVVACEKASLRLLGLSLAEYNAMVSLLLAWLFANSMWRGRGA